MRTPSSTLALTILLGTTALALADAPEQPTEEDAAMKALWASLPTLPVAEKIRARLAHRGPSMGLPGLDTSSTRLEGTWADPKVGPGLLHHATALASHGHYALVEEPDRATGQGSLVIDVHFPGLRIGQDDGVQTDVVRMEIRAARVLRAWPHAETRAEVTARLFD